MSNSVNRSLIGVFFVTGLLLTLACLMALGGGWLSGKHPQAIIYFNQDVSGLDTGSPLRLRGVTIGKVSKILIRAGDQPGQERAVPVVVMIDPAIASRLGAGEQLGTPEGVESAIKDGLCAKLKMQSIITGVLFVDLDYANAKPVEIRRVDGMPEIPSVLSDHVTLSQALNRTMENLSMVDFKGISERFNALISSVSHLTEDPALVQAGKDLSAAMTSFSHLSDKLNAEVTPLTEDLRATSVEARKALAKLGAAADQLNDLARRDGATRLQVDQAVADFSQAAQAVKSLADYLDRNPESLLRGKRRESTPPSSNP